MPPIDVFDPIRFEKMVKMREAGANLEAIGAEFGISKQRVWEIFKKQLGTTRPKSLVTRHRLAAIIGVNPEKITCLEKRGFIIPIRFGHRYYYRTDNIEDVRKLVFALRKRKKQEREQVILTCEECGKTFPRPPYRVRKTSPGRFCSRFCQGKYAGRNYGFMAHPENACICGRRRRKHDWEKVWRTKQETKLSDVKVSKLLGIPASTVHVIIRKYKTSNPLIDSKLNAS